MQLAQNGRGYPRGVGARPCPTDRRMGALLPLLGGAKLGAVRNHVEDKLGANIGESTQGAGMSDRHPLGALVGRKEKSRRRATTMAQKDLTDRTDILRNMAKRAQPVLM